VALQAQAVATHFDIDFHCSTQEEADTKIILQSISVKERGAMRLLIFAQDTDVLVIAVLSYPRLPNNTFLYASWISN